MGRLKASEARSQWKSVLNRAAMGEIVEIDRGGLIFELRLASKQTQAGVRQLLESDTGVEEFDVGGVRSMTNEVIEQQLEKAEKELAAVDPDTQDPDQIHRGETLFKWVTELKEEKKRRGIA